MRFLSCGREALLVEVDDLDQALALYAALHGAELPGVVDLVPAARTVLIHLDPSVTSPDKVRAATEGLHFDDAPPAAAGTIEIPVVYDGPDLADVAAHLGVTPAEVVAMHTGTAWTVAFGGFAPGFGYLTGGDARLDVPRLDVPRTRIPAGSVALAGRYSGVYPNDSPGGWRLIGHTELQMWDLNRPEPALLTPGVRVTFKEIPASAGDGPTHKGQGAVAFAEPLPSPAGGAVADGYALAEPHLQPAEGGLAHEDGVTVSVLRTGPLTVLKDAGRPGHAAQGVASSGAVDRTAYARANALAGNPAGAAVLECTLGGLRLRFDKPAVIVLTGTDAVLSVDGVRGAPEQVLTVAAGAEVTVSTPRQGLRSYLAVRGGFAAPPVLNSRSTDQLGIGPPPLTPHTTLPIGPPPTAAQVLPAPRRDSPPQVIPLSDGRPSALPPRDRPPQRALLDGRTLQAARPDDGAPTEASPGDGPPKANPPADPPLGDGSPEATRLSDQASRADPPDDGTAQAGSIEGGTRKVVVPGGGPLILDVDLGPRDDWFSAGAVEVLVGAEFTVTAASNSVGVRLAGPALERARGGELPSEGVVRGSVQVPPNGQPIVFQADHPVTGGYPVIAVLTPAAADLIAQARPGQTVRFRPAD